MRLHNPNIVHFIIRISKAFIPKSCSFLPAVRHVRDLFLHASSSPLPRAEEAGPSIPSPYARRHHRPSRTPEAVIQKFILSSTGLSVKDKFRHILFE